MADDFTTGKIGALKQGTGDNENDWGSRMNDETVDPICTAIDGYLEKDVAGAVDVTLSDDEARNAFIKLTGALTGDIDVIVPAAEGGYFIWNATSGAFTVTVKTSAGTGIIVAQDTRAHLWCDATNVVGVWAEATRDAPTATGSSGAYTASPAAPLPAALRSGMPFAFKANHANSGATTLTWAGLTQKNLYLIGSSGAIAMSGSEIQSGAMISGYYDGTQFVATAGLTNQTGIALLSAANTFTADQTIQANDDGGGPAPNLNFDRISASPAAADVLADIHFKGYNSGGGHVDYVTAYATIVDPTAAATFGAFHIATLKNSSLTDSFVVGQGVVVGNPTGGDLGANKLNAGAIYVNGDTVVGGGGQYDSGNQTISTSGGLNLAHGLGVKPKLVVPVLRCASAEAGYSVGDEVFIGPADMTLSTDRGISIKVDATNITVRYGASAGVFLIPHASTGTGTILTNSNWKLIIRAYA